MASREDTRMRRSDAAKTRGARSTQDHERINNDGTGLTLEERRHMLRNELVSETLPRAPDIPGYHLCWLTTNSTYDPLHKRLRMGYELVTKEEMKGFLVNSKFSQNPEYESYVTCNEMVLAKIPVDIYKMMMEEMHHNMPREEEEKIRENVQQSLEQARQYEEDREDKPVSEASDALSFKETRNRKPTFEI